MEFVNRSEVDDVLKEHGYREVVDGDRVQLTMPDEAGVFIHLHSADCPIEPREGATVVESDDLPGVVEHIIHGLSLSDVLLFPVGKWRQVFDAVAFSLASNEAWQEFDASATVELNTRDPLLCGPSDFPLVVELIRALLSDAEGPDQCLILTATAVPVIAQVYPEGAIQLGVGNQALADRVLTAVKVG